MTMECRNRRIFELAVPKNRPDIRLIMERTLPAPVPRNTLYYRATSRIKKLARPKFHHKSIGNRAKPTPIIKVPIQKELSEIRISELAKPKPLIKKVHERCMHTEIQNDYYTKFTVKIKRNAEYYFKRQVWLQKNAAPKVRIQPFPIDFETKPKLLSKSKLKKLVSRLSIIPELKKRKSQQQLPKPTPKSYMEPQQLELSIQRLSKPRKVNEEVIKDIMYNPYFIPKHVLNCVPTQHILDLAQPRVFVNRNTEELKDNPFGVSKAALKYKATKRIIKLAMPIDR